MTFVRSQLTALLVSVKAIILASFFAVLGLIAFSNPAAAQHSCNTATGVIKTSPHHCLSGEANCAVTTVTVLSEMLATNCAEDHAPGFAI